MGNITFLKKPSTKAATKKILHPSFSKWFFSAFKDFTLPQQHALIPIHSRENILVSAPTGSGKTLCAFGAILNELIDLEEKGKLEDKIYCVYLSPLRALSNDIERNLQQPLKEIGEQRGKPVDVRVGVRTGDTTAYEKQKMTKNPPHIFITTPESLAISLSSTKFREHLKDVQWVIVDEIHSLAENKRGVHLSLSLERLQRLSPGICRVGLSATVAPLDEVARFLVGSKRNCKVVDVQFIKEYDFEVMSPVPDLMHTSQQELHHRMYELLDGLIQKHRTTLIFTNTRAGTERVVHHLKERFPKNYIEEQEDKTGVEQRIGAHHGSLSRKHRLDLEKRLKEGKLKAVVCSTSLELGIDIGYVDLVVCLGSPKSVARLLQRAGRSGHQLDKVTKARVIVLDRDDLMECSVMLKQALEKKIDTIHIPTHCLDVLAQHLVGMSLDDVWEVEDVYAFIQQSYCYAGLPRKDFDQVLHYLAGDFASLEERHVYARLWNKEGKMGRKGKLTRVLYMTNLGTIPDETSIKVQIGDAFIGTIEEGFLERLKPGDIFVLGGDIYEFRHSRGTVAQVRAVHSRPPTVPSWVSESLPLSYDLAVAIGTCRRLLQEHFEAKANRKDVLAFIHDYLYVDDVAAKAIYHYAKEQYDFCKVLPSDKKILVEHYTHDDQKKIVFHTLFGRRVNDCLSKALAFSIALTQKRDVEVGINDNGFYVHSKKPVNVLAVLEQITPENLDKLMSHALDKSEVFKRRFRHCATRSFMILRSFMGREKRVGRQQQASVILLKALRDIDPNFCIIKETKREVLEDLMDIAHTKEVLQQYHEGDVQVEEIHTKIPSPFAFQLVLQGHLDLLKMEDKIEFLKRMHGLVRAKISLSKGKQKDLLDDTDQVLRTEGTQEQEALNAFEQYQEPLHEVQEQLLASARKIRRMPARFRQELVRLIKEKRMPDKVDSLFLEALSERKKQVQEHWPASLANFMLTYLKDRERFNFEKYFKKAAKDPGRADMLAKERLQEGIQLLARRKKLEDDMKYDLLQAVDTGKVSKETKKWLKEFLKGTIPKWCTDEVYTFLKELKP